MSDAHRKRFRVACVVAVLSSSLTVLTLIWPDWIELLFGAEPDGGDGSLEWTLVVFLLTVTVAVAALARFEWRRARAELEST